jgi:antitoxin CptB
VNSPKSDVSRLRWRCRRGFLELDLLLTDFLERDYPALAPSQQSAFIRLLEIPDDQLLAFFQGRLIPEDSDIKGIIKIIRNYPMDVCTASPV